MARIGAGRIERCFTTDIHPWNPW